jgi:transposase
MPAERISMRKIREALRLRHAGNLSYQQIAQSLRISISTAHSYIKIAEAAGLSWPLPADFDELELEQRLFAKEYKIKAKPPLIKPDFEMIHRELQHKGVTLQLLWDEYSADDRQHSYGYAQFCYLYRQWRGHLKASLRQTHRAGEKLFVDYAGQTVAIIEAETNEVKQAQIFVAVLGASNYTYAEATWTQQLPDWIGAHVRALNFFGGVMEIIVPDNLKAGVSRACRYEPDLNPTYAEFAEYYGCAIIPTRPRKPKDKAKVEFGVQLVERWILARLRHQTFFSLTGLNAAIERLLSDLNQRPFKRLPGSRLSQFNTLDRPALKPLPAQPYLYAEWRKARVGLDYHLEIDGHHYSVPHALLRRQLDVRLTATTVECFYHRRRVASHPRSHQVGGQTTLLEHMPRAHRIYREWSPKSLREWGATIGFHTQQVVEHLLRSQPHPECGFRSCLGIVSLAKQYGEERLEAACRRALAVDAVTRNSLAAMLRQGLDRLPLPETGEVSITALTPPHENIRGAAYYQQTGSPT